MLVKARRGSCFTRSPGLVRLYGVGKGRVSWNSLRLDHLGVAALEPSGMQKLKLIGNHNRGTTAGESGAACNLQFIRNLLKQIYIRDRSKTTEFRGNFFILGIYLKLPSLQS